jgi:archaellum component FlaF (FlaF/FlaG flagellin family)
MVTKNKTPTFLKRFIINRKGTAEVIGSVLFIIILLFAFSNIYLWHDSATKTMNTLLSDKLNSQIEVHWSLDAGVETSTLVVTNTGGVGASLSRLWIVTAGQHQHFELGDRYVAAGGSIKIDVSKSPISHTKIDGDTFTVLTTLGNMASPRGQIIFVDSNGGGGGESIGDFVPDYHSVQWRGSSGSWASGWIVPVSDNNKLMWKVDLTYYGVNSITVDKNSYMFFSPLNSQEGSGHPPQKFYLVDADLSPSDGVLVAASNEGTKITLYFASSTPGGNADGIDLDTHNGNDFSISLIIYGASPSTYAQSFPLYAMQIR